MNYIDAIASLITEDISRNSGMAQETTILDILISSGLLTEDNGMNVQHAQRMIRKAIKDTLKRNGQMPDPQLIENIFQSIQNHFSRAEDAFNVTPPQIEEAVTSFLRSRGIRAMPTDTTQTPRVSKLVSGPGRGDKRFMSQQRQDRIDSALDIAV